MVNVTIYGIHGSYGYGKQNNIMMHPLEMSLSRALLEDILEQDGINLQVHPGLEILEESTAEQRLGSRGVMTSDDHATKMC